jgi:hypothetical protein
MVLGDVGLDDLTLSRLNAAKRTLLILAYQPAVANHVCHQNGREPTLQSWLMHSRSP